MNAKERILGKLRASLAGTTAVADDYDIGLVTDPRTGRLIVLSAIDNLCRGASGQAVANANLMLGLGEESGLPFAPLMP